MMSVIMDVPIEREAPLIAVSTSEIRDITPAYAAEHGEPPRREMVLGLRYLQAVQDAGGTPVVVPPLGARALASILKRVDGVCLSGGPDLDPSCYGESDHEQLGPTFPALDQFELALMRGADRARLPVLAICRGLQLVNVARGGTLHQHLPDTMGDAVVHRLDADNGTAIHDVRIDPASRLAAILGDSEIRVNSYHHQATARLGDGLVPVAWAQDGTVEGLEDPDGRFVVAVQWHAEALAAERSDQLGLFAAFVDAARRHSGAAREDDPSADLLAS
jgi:putative glutamine amidotransferase